MAIQVTVWNEYLHEVQFPEVAKVYPKGIHGCIQQFLEEDGCIVRTDGCADLVGAYGAR